MREGVISEFRDAHFLIIIKSNGCRGRNAHFSEGIESFSLSLTMIVCLKMYPIHKEFDANNTTNKGETNSKYSRFYQKISTFFLSFKVNHSAPLDPIPLLWERQSLSMKLNSEKISPLALLSQHRVEKRAISVESIGARLGILMNYSTSSMIFLWDCDFKKRIDCWHYPRLSVPIDAIKQRVQIHWKISKRSHTAIVSSFMRKVHDSSTLTDAFEWG